MEQIKFSFAKYEALRQQFGAKAAVDAIRVDIEQLTGRTIEHVMRGPNHLGEMIASLSFVRAAAWSDNGKGFRVNLLTCGFSEREDVAIENLFNMLTHPEVPKLVIPDKVIDPEHDTPEHEPAEEVIGLIVGAHAHPNAFIRFEK